MFTASVKIHACVEVPGKYGLIVDVVCIQFEVGQYFVNIRIFCPDGYEIKCVVYSDRDEIIAPSVVPVQGFKSDSRLCKDAKTFRFVLSWYPLIVLLQTLCSFCIRLLSARLRGFHILV